MVDERYIKVRNYALKLLSFRPRSKREISQRLIRYIKKYSYPSEFVSQIVEELESNNLINDEEFVTWWIDQRIDFNPRGKILIKIELLKKGVKEDLIDKIISQSEKLIKNEYELAKRVVKKKSRVYRGISTKELKLKVNSMLSRRGFSRETINKIIDSYGEKL